MKLNTLKTLYQTQISSLILVLFLKLNKTCFITYGVILEIITCLFCSQLTYNVTRRVNILRYLCAEKKMFFVLTLFYIDYEQLFTI